MVVSYCHSAESHQMGWQMVYAFSWVSFPVVPLYVRLKGHWRTPEPACRAAHPCSAPSNPPFACRETGSPGVVCRVNSGYVLQSLSSSERVQSPCVRRQNDAKGVRFTGRQNAVSGAMLACVPYLLAQRLSIVAEKWVLYRTAQSTQEGELGKPDY